nr:type 2 ribosome-inactivating protein [Tanacetum cinerariifolium]
MRLFLATLLAVIYLYLGLGGVQRDTKYDKNKFYYNNGDRPNIIAYIKLFEELRARLASRTDVHRISITHPHENIPLQERFVQVQLENGGEELIIVIIDTVNVYVVGYLSGSTLRPTLYYLDDIPREELLQAFPSTDYTHSRLGFSGNYGSLPDKDRIELGHGVLNYAIINLYYGRSQPSALLVIIQMVAEAVRIRYIEHFILRNMYANLNFIPDSRDISLKNRWSDLSQQIQWSGESGVFRREIEVRSALNVVVPIRNEEDFMSLAALALMLYQVAKCNPKAIRMPVPVADEQCSDGEPTTNIVERDGQCVNVKDIANNIMGISLFWEHAEMLNVTSSGHSNLMAPSGPIENA